jgi:hypothetical protein
MRVIIIIMAVMFVAGIVAWLVLFQSYTDLINDIRKKQHRTALVKQVVLKYDTCKRLELSIYDVNAFVERVIEGQTVLGLQLAEWEFVAKSMKYLVAVVGGITAFVMRNNLYTVYMYMAVAALSIIALQLMDRLTDVKTLHKALTQELVEELERSSPSECMIDGQITAKLTRGAASEFVKLNRCYEKIELACRSGNHIDNKLTIGVK